MHFNSTIIVSNGRESHEFLTIGYVV